jgi:HPt (histidine-containing phosphotransfer) domain-containing protein
MAAHAHRTGSNPMRKIIFMVGIAILVFLAVTSFSVRKSVQSGDQLSAIKDRYHPVLQKIEANIVRLDKMEELFMRSAMLGEHDPLDEAQDVNAQAGKAFDEMMQIYPERRAEIARLRDELQRYDQLAFTTAEAFLAKQIGDMPAKTKEMNKVLAHLRASIHTFREASYNNFVEALASSQHTVTLNLYMGIALGIMNLCFMGVLVYFIRNNMRMMSVIAEQNATLELRVAERTSQLRQKTHDIQAMLQNMPQGVLTVLPGGVIHPEYSAYMETLFETGDIAGRSLMDLVFGHTSLGANDLSQVEATLGSCIGEDRMNFEFNSHLLVTELDMAMPDGRIKSLELGWSPIADDHEVVEKLMLCVRDVTAFKQLASEAGAQKRELEIIGEILAVTQEKFQDFIEGARQFVDDNERFIRAAQAKDADTIGLLFRNMHTIKGNARTYGLLHMTNTVHETEQAYDTLRKDDAQPWAPDVLLAQLAQVGALVDEYQHINDDKLGRKGPGRRGNVERFLMVEKDQVSQALALLRQARQADAVDVHATLEQVGHTLQRIGTDTLENVLAGILDSLPSLARELGKSPPRVSIQDHGITVRNQSAGLLKNVFTHLLRNAMDHGLEPPEARTASGKAPVGHIQVDMAIADGQLQLRLHDDGRGLPLARIRGKAEAQGLIDAAAVPGAEDVAQLIFASGFSTAEQLTEVSGRGVGMDAVRGFLRQEGGDVRIRLLGSEALADWQPFELLITLPASHAVWPQALAA